jgi:putative peptidoglycan lipid II flippase
LTDSVAPPEPAPRPGSGVVGGAVLIAAITIAARLAGFGRIVVFARAVGPTCLGDVYTTANTVPNIVFDIVAGGALSSLVVPVLAGRVSSTAEADREAARRVTGALLTWVVVLLAPVSVLGALLSHPLMSLLVGSGRPGCNRTVEVALGARMLQVFAPQILLYGIGIVLAGVLQAQRRFLGPAIAPLLSSLVVVGVYLGFRGLSPHVDLSSNLHAATWLLAGGTTLGVAALSLPLAIPGLAGRGIRPSLRFPPGVAAAVARLAVSGAVVLAGQDLATGVMLRLANGRGVAGSVVVYSLAWTVFQLPWAVLAVPLATSAFPTLAADWQAGRRREYMQLLHGSTQVVLGLAAVAAAVVIATADPAARVLVSGAPGAIAPAVLARASTALAPGLVGYGLTALWSRARYAAADPWAPATAAILGWGVAIASDVLVVPRVSAGSVPAALCAGTAAGVTVTGVVLAGRLGRTHAVEFGALRRPAAASLLAAAAGAAVGRLVCELLATSGPVASVGSVIAGGSTCVTVAGGVLALADRRMLFSAWRGLRQVR